MTPGNGARPFLTAEWRHLAMLNYPVDRAVLEPFVPKGAMLDTYQGVAYVSMVGFLFLNTRILGVRVPWHRDFEEVNLRFYVRRFTGNDWRRGVVFIREIVRKPAISVVARTIYNERYLTLPMRHEVELHPDRQTAASIEYHWQIDGRWNRLRVTTDSSAGAGREPTPGSLEEFISEHYWGYVRHRDGSTVEYPVAHPRWQVFAARPATLDCDVARLYGDSFVSALQSPPTSAFIATGSPITLYRGKRITTG